MTTYLYVKTHKITGLKYLGKTTRNPYRYNGSGICWLLHLNKHGDNHDTDILMECQSKEEVKKWGLYYSELWNVVDSDEWANLKPENGDGGSEKGRKYGKYAPERVAASGKARTGIPAKPEDVARRAAANRGKKRSAESIARYINAARNRPSDYTAHLAEARKGCSCWVNEAGKIKYSRECPGEGFTRTRTS